MPVGAAIGSVVGTVAVGAYSANKQAKAAERASDAQVEASDKATELQGRIYEDQRNLLTPTALAGAGARARQMLMTGSSPEEVKQYLSSMRSAVGTPGGVSQITGQPAASTDWAGYADHYGILDEARTGTIASQNRPSEWARSLTERGITDPAAIGRDYYEQWGRSAGHALPGAPGGPRATNAAAPAAAVNNNDLSWVDEWDPEAFLRSTPGYQFRLDEGRDAIDASASASGRLFSGRTGKELQRYGQDYASAEYGDLYDRLGGLAGTGDASKGQIINVAGQYGQNASGNIRDAGAARASSYLGVADAQAGFWGETVPGAIGRTYGIGSKSGWFG